MTASDMIGDEMTATVDDVRPVRGAAGLSQVSESACPLIVFAGGGTAGHLYPALAIASSIRVRLPRARFLFFGTRRPIDRQVLEAAGEELATQDVRPLTVKPWKIPGFLRAWRRSRHQCRARFRVDPPAVVVGTGGFASGPAVCEAARLGIPCALLNPDLVPGIANRKLASKVDCVFAQWAESRAYFRGGVSVEATGCPVRSEFVAASRADGVRRFGLRSDLRTLLVTGGSSGSRSINGALALLAPALAKAAVVSGGDGGWQVLHLTGSGDAGAVESAYALHGVPAVVLEYTEFMAEAMAVADLVVSRAGASLLAEIAAMGKPAILLPYPHHRDQHQLKQAEVLASNGAACVVVDRIEPALVAAGLERPLLELLTDVAALGRMQAAAALRCRGDAAVLIADRLLAMAAAGAVG